MSGNTGVLEPRASGWSGTLPESVVRNHLLQVLFGLLALDEREQSAYVPRHLERDEVQRLLGDRVPAVEQAHFRRSRNGELWHCYRDTITHAWVVAVCRNGPHSGIRCSSDGWALWRQIDVVVAAWNDRGRQP